MTHDTVFLVDVDNTLLDNDAVIADLHVHLARAFGAESVRYWAHFEAIREELGYADYLGALQRYRADVEASFGCERNLLAISEFLIDYPFADRLYPRALDVLAALRKVGQTTLLSDGDVVFQPRKLKRSGLWDAVEGRVMIFVHKEARAATVRRLYPARHYVMVDDKLRLLDAMQHAMGGQLGTVFVRQGHYAREVCDEAANEPAGAGRDRRAHLTLDRIEDLLSLDLSALGRRP